MSMEAFLRQGFLPFEDAIRRVPEELAAAIAGLTVTLEAERAAPRRPAFVAIGASLAAMAPAVHWLARHGVAARRISAAELEHGSPDDLADLVVAVSQSGRSKETAAALKGIRVPTVALVNVTESPIAAGADRVISLGDVPDSLASSIGYCATVVAGSMLAETWVLGRPLANWSTLGERLATFLESSMPTVLRIAELVEHAAAIDLVAPFNQLGVAEAGALLLREVPRIPASPFESRQYLHGPMEASAPGGLHIIVDGADSPHLLPKLQLAGLPVVLFGVPPRLTSFLPGAGVSLVLPAETDAEVTVFAAVALQQVVAVVAAVRGIDPDQFLSLGADIKIDGEPPVVQNELAGREGS